MKQFSRKKGMVIFYWRIREDGTHALESVVIDPDNYEEQIQQIENQEDFVKWFAPVDKQVNGTEFKKIY